MGPLRSRSCLLPATFALLLGCDEDGGGCSPGCEKCEEAIAHMAGKIEQFGCNPDLMERAHDRIIEDCEEFNPETTIGLIVEECNTGEGISMAGRCRPTSANLRIDFAVDPTIADAYPNGVRAELRISPGTTDFEGLIEPNGEFDIPSGGTSQWTGEVFAEDTIAVRVTEVGDPEAELAVGSELFRVRTTTDYWTFYPFRTVLFTESDDGVPIVEFLDF